MAWDTNILIDWAKFGSALLADESHLDAEVADSEYLEQLIALRGLMNLPWMTRDIRIHPLGRQLVDFGRRSPSEDLEKLRGHQLAEMMTALAHVELDREVPASDELAVGHPWEVPVLSASQDRQLVEEAIVVGCHVFLTRDKGILASAEQVAFLGLALMTPTDLLDALAVSGELNSPFGADGMVCDNHKWQHLWALVTPSEEDK